MNMPLEIIYVNLIVIALLSILSSELVYTILRPIYESKSRGLGWLLYFLSCDLCKGFWLTFALCYLNYFEKGFFFTLLCYGLLVIYLAIRDRDG
jgi:hypothetical protein